MNKNYQSFESYLGEICPDTGRGGADSAHEAYERWIENLDVAEVMEFAEDWGRKMYKRGQDFDINLGLNAEENAQALDTIEHEKKLSDEKPH